jgi:hypothetical protein
VGAKWLEAEVSVDCDSPSQLEIAHQTRNRALNFELAGWIFSLSRDWTVSSGTPNHPIQASSGDGVSPTVLSTLRMCDRITITVPAAEIAELMGLPELPAFAPRYNVKLTTSILTMVRWTGSASPRRRCGASPPRGPRRGR